MKEKKLSNEQQCRINMLKEKWLVELDEIHRSEEAEDKKDPHPPRLDFRLNFERSKLTHKYAPLINAIQIENGELNDKQLLILRHLEKDLDSQHIDIKAINAEKLGLHVLVWERLLLTLQYAGYIKGLKTYITKKGIWRLVEPIRPEITLKGLEYLENRENI